MKKKVGEVGTVEVGSSEEIEREGGRKEKEKDGLVQQQAGGTGGKKERERDGESRKGRGRVEARGERQMEQRRRERTGKMGMS